MQVDHEQFSEELRQVAIYVNGQAVATPA
jgi:hypothetical protein